MANSPSHNHWQSTPKLIAVLIACVVVNAPLSPALALPGEEIGVVRDRFKKGSDPASLLRPSETFTSGAVSGLGTSGEPEVPDFEYLGTSGDLKFAYGVSIEKGGMSLYESVFVHSRTTSFARRDRAALSALELALGAGVRADFLSAKVRGTQGSPAGTGSVCYLAGRRFGYAYRSEFPNTLYITTPARLSDLVTQLAMRCAN